MVDRDKNYPILDWFLYAFIAVVSSLFSYHICIMLFEKTQEFLLDSPFIGIVFICNWIFFTGLIGWIILLCTKKYL